MSAANAHTADQALASQGYKALNVFAGPFCGRRSRVVAASRPQNGPNAPANSWPRNGPEALAGACAPD